MKHFNVLLKIIVIIISNLLSLLAPAQPTYAAWYQCIDFINPSRIFVGGMEDKGSTIWNPNPSWVYVACLNDNLDLINEEYLGGDALYETYYVKATYDGGVILTGSKYNDSIQDHERDGFLMKFDSAMFVDTPENQEIKLSGNIQVFPNPGNDIISIKAEMPISSFIMYNPLGIKVYSVQNPGQRFDIQTSFLKKSFYCYVAQFENSCIITGIWIKE